MEDKWNIKKALESQGDVHEKVTNQSNSELPSLSPTQSPGPPRIQIDMQITYNLRFGRSTYAWKAKKITFPMAPFLCPTKIGASTIIKKVPISRIIFGAAPPFWPDGPCIQLESIRDASLGSATTLNALYLAAAIILHGFCLD
jgi:hypothetical protein